MKLFRPVGVRELLLIRSTEFRSFPPRLEHQPFFYPVLDQAYAEQIARDWNTKDEASGFAGFVTAFDVPDSILATYPARTVGKSSHQELWVPAAELADFNDLLQSPIRVIRYYLGSSFSGTLDDDNLPTSVPLGVSERRDWCVRRFDDNGNEFLVQRGLDLEQALHLAADFEARGHKQTYFAQARDIRSPTPTSKPTTDRSNRTKPA